MISLLLWASGASKLIRNEGKGLHGNVPNECFSSGGRWTGAKESFWKWWANNPSNASSWHLIALSTILCSSATVDLRCYFATLLRMSWGECEVWGALRIHELGTPVLFKGRGRAGLSIRTILLLADWLAGWLYQRKKRSNPDFDKPRNSPRLFHHEGRQPTKRRQTYIEYSNFLKRTQRKRVFIGV